MPHFLYVWPTVSQRLRDARRVLVMLDYDGTLTPIVDRPELAILPPETKESLRNLSLSKKYLVGIISSRSLEDVSTKVGLNGLIYAGNHGLEIKGPGLEFVHPEAVQLLGTVDQAFQQLQQALAHLTGVIIEHKGMTLTVHYRLTPEGAVDQVRKGVDMTVGPFVESGALSVFPGKKTWEIRPRVAWHKGYTVSKLQESFPQATIAVYFGDDLPDEDGFAAVQETGGMGVFVGPSGPATSALYRLDSPQEVGEVLRLMVHV